MVEQQSLGALIRRRRAELGLTQTRLAELVGKSPSAVRGWERDRNLPADEASLAALVAVLGLTDEEVSAAVAGAVAADSEQLSAGWIQDGSTQEAPAEPAVPEAPEAPPTAPDEIEDRPTTDAGAPVLPDAAPTEVRSAPAPPPAVPSIVTRRERTPSYLDDPDEVNTYRLRTALTVILLLVLFIILAWAFGEARDALGSLFGDSAP